MTPKTPTQRVQALRQRRTELGLTRLDLYAHPYDHAAIKALANLLQAEHEAKKIRAQKKTANVFDKAKEPHD
jgi:hypothetical protein